MFLCQIPEFLFRMSKEVIKFNLKSVLKVVELPDETGNGERNRPFLWNIRHIDIKKKSIREEGLGSDLFGLRSR